LSVRQSVRDYWNNRRVEWVLRRENPDFDQRTFLHVCPMADTLFLCMSLCSLPSFRIYRSSFSSKLLQVPCTHLISVLAVSAQLPRRFGTVLQTQFVHLTHSVLSDGTLKQPFPSSFEHPLATNFSASCVSIHAWRFINVLLTYMCLRECRLCRVAGNIGRIFFSAKTLVLNRTSV